MNVFDSTINQIRVEFKKKNTRQRKPSYPRETSEREAEHQTTRSNVPFKKSLSNDYSLSVVPVET